eukprot:16445515-Heterocapsa_arctica.AAC.1
MIEDMKMDVDGDEKKKVTVPRRGGGSEEGERLEARVRAESQVEDSSRSAGFMEFCAIKMLAQPIS